MPTYSRLGPYKGKIVDIQPVDKSSMMLIVEGPKKKKYKYRVGRRSEFVRRALRYNDKRVAFMLDERGNVTVMTKSKYRYKR